MVTLLDTLHSEITSPGAIFIVASLPELSAGGISVNQQKTRPDAL